MSKEIYPLTIILDRYDGAYSGGKYLAFNEDYVDIPPSINGTDTQCKEFWDTHKDYLVGRGETIVEARIDLTVKLIKPAGE